MCFALPLKVVSSSIKNAIMEDGRKVDISIIGSAKKGEWLLVKTNLAVEKLTKKEAQVMRSAIKEVTNELQL